MKTVADIIALWPSAEHFASDIGLKHLSYGRVIKMRGRIPPVRWDRVLQAAEARGLPVTRADIERAHADAPEAVRAEIEREACA